MMRRRIAVVGVALLAVVGVALAARPDGQQPAAVGRMQFVGATVALFDGNMGGILGTARNCQTEYADSRMCTPTEYRETTALPANIEPGVGLPFDMWVRINNNAACSGWTVAGIGNDYGTAMGWTGETVAPLPCDVPRSIACCAAKP